MAEEFEFDRDVPLPGRGGGGGPASKYNVHPMQPGDSRFWPLDGLSAKRLRKQLTTAGQNVRRRGSAEARFATRHLTENGIDGIRIWRLS